MRNASGRDPHRVRRTRPLARPPPHNRAFPIVGLAWLVLGLGELSMGCPPVAHHDPGVVQAQQLLDHVGTAAGSHGVDRGGLGGGGPQPGPPPLHSPADLVRGDDRGLPYLVAQGAVHLLALAGDALCGPVTSVLGATRTPVAWASTSALLPKESPAS